LLAMGVGRGDKPNIAYGGAGNDVISAESSRSDAMIIGGEGNDSMTASRYADTTFVWLAGDAGTVPLPAMDTILGFNKDDRSLTSSSYAGRDKLDLRELLIGEDDPGADLTHFLNIAFDGKDTVINISSVGNLNTGGSNFDQQIRLYNTDLTGGVTDQQQIINDLIKAGTLLVDQ